MSLFMNEYNTNFAIETSKTQKHEYTLNSN